MRILRESANSDGLRNNRERMVGLVAIWLATGGDGFVKKQRFQEVDILLPDPGAAANINRKKAATLRAA